MRHHNNRCNTTQVSNLTHLQKMAKRMTNYKIANTDNNISEYHKSIFLKLNVQSKASQEICNNSKTQTRSMGSKKDQWYFENNFFFCVFSS